MHLDNLFFIVLVALAAFIRWAMQQAQNPKQPGANGRAPSSPAVPPAPSAPRKEETDEERIRRFLDALGQPQGTAPPPKVRPRPTLPRRRVPIRPIDPFPRPAPLPRSSADEPTAVPATPPLPAEATEPQVVARMASPAAPINPAAFEVRSEAEERAGWALREQPRPKVPRAAADFSAGAAAALLRGPAGLRQAVILREIFGPPRSLQSTE